MYKDRSKEKLVNAIVYFIKHTKHCHITKLMKLLYTLDFEHYQQTGFSVTGLKYHAWDMGPVPVPVWRELSKCEDSGLGLMSNFKVIDEEYSNGKIRKNMSTNLKFNPKVFTKRQIKLLENISFIFKNALADTMVEYTHSLKSPWDITIKEKGPKSEIDYSLAIDKKILPQDEIEDKNKTNNDMIELLNSL